MMEYLTYAHILYGEVYQVGDFGAVALWYQNSFFSFAGG
jgi:hypothetical protein